ncbi:hypothetical protein WICMUC_000139 [Wickerhamomyces mucosus]|uniref:Cation efflux protein transmembrane domain-containing protein n=1 Tax=Wickerhamomyces mucosus TaxID=1378264 RepID=A0A9P8PYG1_9ASCO|nr:hypothetical protein WICMUC_000139 [Wickerhamomyces mucosus]
MFKNLFISRHYNVLLSTRSNLKPISIASNLININRQFNSTSIKFAKIDNHTSHSHSHSHNSSHSSHSHSHDNELNDHDHVHLRESETEQNDSYSFGKLLSNHDHDHSHGPNKLLILDRKQFWNNPGVRITWIGLLINVGMALGKFIGGIVFHSQALIADSVHATSDLVSDFLTMGTVGLAARGPNNEFPYGYGKVETVGSLAVSSILALAGLSIGWASLISIVGPIIPHTIVDTLNAYHIHILSASHGGHSHGGAATAADLTNVNAAWIAGASIVAKEWIFKETSKIAQQTNSKVLLANAWHHRVDSLTSLVALVTITSGHFLNITSLDAVGGLLVSGLIIKAGFNGIKLAINELIDRSIPIDDERYLSIKNELNEILIEMLSNNNSRKNYEIHRLILLTSGPNLHAKLILKVPLQRWNNVLDINEFEIVSQHVKNKLIDKIDNLRNVTIEFIGEKEELKQEEIKS